MASAGTAYIDFQGRFDDVLRDVQQAGRRAAGLFGDGFAGGNVGRDIGNDITRGLGGALDDTRNLGRRAGQGIAGGLNGRNIGQEAGSDINRGLGSGLGDLRRAGARAGDRFGDGFQSAADRSVKGMAGKVAGGLAAAFAGAQVVGLLGTAFEEAREAAEIGRLTEAVLESTGEAANLTASEISDLAGELSKKSGIDDEVIQSGENLLLTFTKVRDEVGEGNDIFSQATELALDMSVAMGTEMRGAAMQLGKALNDPIKGMSTLGRAGVQFSEDQKEQIKTMVEAGDILGAQKIILGELETQFGGAAEAASDPIKQLGVVWGNFLEDVGGKLLPWVSDAVEGLGEWLPGAVDTTVAAFDTLITRGKEIGAALWERIQPAAEDLWEALQNLGEIAVQLYDDLKPIGEVLLVIGGSAVLLAVTAVAEALKAVSGFLADNEAALDLLITGFATFAAAKYGSRVIGVVSAAFDTLALAAYDATGKVEGLRLAVSNIGSGVAVFGLVTAGLLTLKTAYDNAGEQANEWRDAVESQIDAGAVESYTGAIEDSRAKQAEAEQYLTDIGAKNATLWERAKSLYVGNIQLFTPLKNTVLDTARAYNEATEAEREWTRQQNIQKIALQLIADQVGISTGAVERYVDTLNLPTDPSQWQANADEIDRARRMAEEGTPATETLAAAYGVLGDETATATDQLTAWKDAMDAIMGVHITYEEAQIGFAESIMALTDAQRDALFAGEQWSTNLFGGDALSLETRSQIAALADEAINVATSFGEAGGGIDGATMKLAENREAIIRAGEAAGISRADMEAYLDTLGLTPENIATNLDLTGEQAVEAALNHTTRPRRSLIEAVMAEDSAALAQARIDELTRTREMYVNVRIVGNDIGVVTGAGAGLRRWGGIHETARWGRIPAQITKDPTILFGERATGGEAMIPRLGNYARSMSILSKAADWYNAKVVPESMFRNMAGRSADVPTGQPGGGGTHVTINEANNGPQIWADLQLGLALNGVI